MDQSSKTHCKLVYTCFILCVRLYTLTVTATDQDPNSPRSGTATVVISVRDLNDNEPIFSPAVYVVTDIFENETTISIPLQASDADSGINAMIGYTIIGGNHNMTFVIGQ